MAYDVDKTLISEGVFHFTTDSNCKYVTKISETSKNSGLWTIDFIKLSGSPSEFEVFKTMKTMTETVIEYVDKMNIKNMMIFISGSNELEIEKKTKTFQRWMVGWDFEIIKNMEIKVSGLRNPIFVPTNTFMMKRKQNSISSQDVNKTGIKNIEIKFCFNCGTENQGFQFCPTCGTNLKQN